MFRSAARGTFALGTLLAPFTPSMPSPPQTARSNDRHLLTNRVIIKRCPRSWGSDEVMDFVERVFAENLQGGMKHSATLGVDPMRNALFKPPPGSEDGRGPVELDSPVAAVRWRHGTRSGRARHQASVEFISEAHATRFLSLIDGYLAQVMIKGVESSEQRFAMRRSLADRAQQKSEVPDDVSAELMKEQATQKMNRFSNDDEDGGADPQADAKKAMAQEEEEELERLQDEEAEEEERFLTAAKARRIVVEPVLQSDEVEGHLSPESTFLDDADDANDGSFNQRQEEEAQRQKRKEKVLSVIREALTDFRASDEKLKKDEASPEKRREKMLSAAKTEELLRASTNASSSSVSAMHAAVQARKNVEAIQALEKTNLLLKIMMADGSNEGEGRRGADKTDNGNDDSEGAPKRSPLHFSDPHEALRDKINRKLKKRSGARYHSQRLTKLYTDVNRDEDLARARSTLDLDRFCLSPDVLFEVEQKHQKRFLVGASSSPRTGDSEENGGAMDSVFEEGNGENRVRTGSPRRIEGRTPIREGSPYH